jgi:hypothetical protein
VGRCPVADDPPSHVQRTIASTFFTRRCSICSTTHHAASSASGAGHHTMDFYSAAQHLLGAAFAAVGGTPKGVCPLRAAEMLHYPTCTICSMMHLAAPCC